MFSRSIQGMRAICRTILSYRVQGADVRRDKRKYSRRLLRIEVRYEGLNGEVLKGTAGNISRGGVYIETGHPLEKDSRLRVTLDAHDFGKVIDVPGSVVRVEKGRGMAVEFDDQNHSEIRRLISALRKLDQASLLALSRSALES